MLASDDPLHLSDYCPKLAEKSRRRQIFEKTGGVCIYCEAPNAITLDHVIPRCKGGTEQTSNLVPCCPSCNHSKGAKDWREWYRRQAFYSAEREEYVSRWVG